MINESLGYLLNTSARLIKRNLDAQLKKYDLTSSQWALLKLLFDENNLSQSEIADKSLSDKATIGVIIDKLIEKGLIQKKLSKDDRRSYTVSITDKGSQLSEVVNHCAIVSNEKAIIGLSKEDTDILIKCLNVIIKNL